MFNKLNIYTSDSKFTDGILINIYITNTPSTNLLRYSSISLVWYKVTKFTKFN